MTCQDCKHYNDKPHNLCKKWIMPLDRDNEPCELFEPTQNNVGNALDALDDSWESVSK